MKRLFIIILALILFFPFVSKADQDVTLKAVINTVDAGKIDAIWKEGGEDTTSRGDRVIWGYFYADPDDVIWGSQNNPEVFVKLWYDAGGRVDANFFHVSVPDIEVFATYNGVALKGTATTSTRYIRHYYNENNSDGTSENTEDGIPVAGYNPSNNPHSYPTINNLNIGAMINTVEAKGPIDAFWTLGGTDATSRGDQVVWGHFYAHPGDVSWGSKNNPELFVKIWFDASGRIDVNYFHVSVPDIEVYSDYISDCSYNKKGMTITGDRYIRHEYYQSKSEDNGDASKKVTNSLGMTFIRIEPGTFIMGSPEDELGRNPEHDYERQHEVTLTQAYHLQTTEVTQGQWEAVMGSNPSYFSSCGDDCPVEKVSRNDAQDFIDALNTMGEGSYSLPTEAQWEYAARAGSSTAFARGGITETGCGYDVNLDAMGWYCYNSNSMTHPVAQKTPNAWGLYDMHGNVWEWCRDWYWFDSYGKGAVTDPAGPCLCGTPTSFNRILRGGSWGSYAQNCRSAIRNTHSPSWNSPYAGLRLVLLSLR